MPYVMGMPATKRRRRVKTRPPYRPITEEERREDALVEKRLHQLFGPPSIVHQGNVVDWSWEQYSEALAQLEAEGLIRPASEVVG